MDLWPFYCHTLNQNWYISYFSHFKAIGSLRKNLKGVHIGNRKNGQNGQNGPKMAKIQKMHYFAKKIVHKYILGYILTLWIWLSLIMASQLRNLCTGVKTHQNCDLAKNMAKYAKNGQNYTPLFFIWAHYGTQKVWNDFGNVKFFLSGFTWNHPMTRRLRLNYHKKYTRLSCFNVKTKLL